MKTTLACCVAAVFFVSPTFAQIPQTERDALIALYNSTDGANWDDNDDWMGPVGTECTWYGVTCSGGFVQQLYLWGNFLTGNIPPELGSLPNLSWLSLGQNTLSGSIPPELGALSNLTYLGLSQNQLSGSIPSNLGGLSSIRILDLSENLLSGNIPPELGLLSSLWTLWLDSNQLGGDIPPELGALAELTSLDMQWNQLTGAIPPEFGNLASLEDLHLRSNQLSGSIPPELGSLSELTDLSLTNNLLTGVIPPEFGNLANLEYLRLYSNQLNGSIPPELGSLSKLRHLALDDNRLSGNIPPELEDLDDWLVWLSLSSNQLSGSIPIELASMGVDQIHIRYNALWTDDPDLQAYLDNRDPGWDETQTVAPEDLTVVSVGDRTVWLEWTQIVYTDDDGGYEVFSDNLNGEVVSRGYTPNKLVATFPETGLQPGQPYDFAAATFTRPHSDNQNMNTSGLSPPVMATTGTSGCTTPEVTVSQIRIPYTLTVTSPHDSYLWITGETTASISFDTEDAAYVWVRTAGPNSCDEAAVIFLDPVGVFADGFESGDSSNWSSVVGMEP